VYSELSEDTRRFPVEQQECNKCVGALLQHRIGQVLKHLGFRAKVSKVESNGVDLEVYDNGDNLFLVGEIINWSPYSYLSIPRRNRIIANLSQYHCNKVLIYAAMQGENLLDDLDSYGISKLKIGYQLLPKSFYKHYLEKDMVESRRVDSRKTRKDILEKISNLLNLLRIQNQKSFFESERPPLQICSQVLQEV
jgi:hypothetical protein